MPVIHSQDLIPAVEGYTREVAPPRHSCIVDEHVDLPPAKVQRGIDDRPAARFVARIVGDETCIGKEGQSSDWLQNPGLGLIM